MRMALEPAFLIHTRPFRETSMIAEWFTNSHGRLSSVVRGVRKKSKSVVRPLPFCEYQISCYGKGDMVTITAFDPVINHWLTGNRLTVGLYANELIMRLFTATDAHSIFYNHYREFLSALDSSQNLSQITRGFELNLLKELGYELVLDRDLEGSLIKAEQIYRYDPEVGFCRQNQTENNFDYLGSLLVKMHQRQPLSRSEMHAAKRLTRQALDPHLGSKPVKSRELLTAKHAPDQQQLVNPTCR